MKMLQSNLHFRSSKAPKECLPCCCYNLGLNRTVLAQGLLDIMTSWQQGKGRTLLDHAETDQHGLFMSLGMGLGLFLPGSHSWRSQPPH